MNYVFNIGTLLIIFCLLFICLEFGGIVTVKDVDETSSNTDEVVLLLDISNSMNADDIFVANNKMSRLDAAKKCIYDISKDIDANFALVIFAEQAETIVPISRDNIFINQLAEVISSDFISQQGTNIERGINEAINCFSKKNNNKFLILLTDAESHDGNIDNALKRLQTNNIHIEVVGFGTENGSKIPITSSLYLSEFNGREVVTSLNLQILKQISKDFLIYPFDMQILIKKIESGTSKSLKNYVAGNLELTISNVLLLLILIAISLNTMLNNKH